MIPSIALMIAVYGSARLLNDIGKRYPGNDTTTVFTWLIGGCGIVALWILAILINLTGYSTPN